MPSSTRTACRICSLPTTHWCSLCQNAWYCSEEHYRQDWPHHREQCQGSPQSSPRLTATPSPTEAEHISTAGVLFVSDEERPRFISVKCRPPAQPLLQAYFDSPPESVVLTQGLNGEPLRFPLHIFFSPIALAKGSPINRPIYHITSGAAPKAWCGNVVALKFSGARRQAYTEAGANDLPALSAYFLSYR
ncbi:unnamed protein product [Mycena citricolor]|uniref:MYND-type domain-containing protein n=1 Tax=Mycena citricolor TaxID=2018698 RepID=A0AAD2H1S5_9AGAR|nr:unnamed protein product [Mycena citricolor]CAK5273735.1 unnamed protein product [Mycena citricolor]